METLSVNTWSYIFLLLAAGFLNTLPPVRRHRDVFVLALNLGVYFLLARSFLPALIFYSCLTYLFALLVRERKASQMPIVGISVFILLTLAVFIVGKTMPGLKIHPGMTVKFLVPLGFSYIALQNIAFVITSRDPENGKWPGLIEFLASATFFANITSGPIADLHQIQRDIQRNSVSEEDVRFGLMRIVNGFFKKAVSDLVSVVLLDEGPLHDARIYFIPVLLLKFYMDFSGYTDIAIGGARLLGVSLPENFDRPYSSITIADYWNRWHMTLGGWFKRYFFYPLQILIFRRLRVGEAVQIACVNAVLFLTFVGIGLWHGIDLKFFLWGLLNAAFVLLSNKMIRLRKRCGERLGFWIFNWFTLFLIFVGQLLLLSKGIPEFWENMMTAFSPTLNDGLSWATAFMIALILFLQHRFDGALQEGCWKPKRTYICLIGAQILFAVFIHQSGRGFLYANF